MTDFMTVVVLLAFSNALLANKLMIIPSQTIVGIISPNLRLLQCMTNNDLMCVVQ